MFFITLVSFALRVTAVKETTFLKQVSLDLESDTSLQSQGDEERYHAIIFVSQTSGARLGEKLLAEYSTTKQEFDKKQLYLYDIQDKARRNAGLQHACQFLQTNKQSNLIVAAAGGDGTVSWVVSLFGGYEDEHPNDKCGAVFVPVGSSEPKELNGRILIRHIGFGTGNDFAKSSGYTKEFNMFGEYRKQKTRTWLSTLDNLNLQNKGGVEQHTTWEAIITADKITTVPANKKLDVINVKPGTESEDKVQLKEYVLLYLSGPFSGLMPCKVEQHRATAGNLISAANKNRLSYAKYGFKAFFKKSPPLENYLTVTVQSISPKQILFPSKSQEFLLLVGKTFGGGKTPSSTKTFGDSKIEVLAAGSMWDLATMKFKNVLATQAMLHMEFKSGAWEKEAQGFASKFENREKKVYTIQKDGECRRLEGLTSIDIKPYIRFNVLTYTK